MDVLAGTFVQCFSSRVLMTDYLKTLTIYKCLSLLVIFSKITAITAISPFYQNLLAVQLDGTCDQLDTSKNYIFEGGIDYFNQRFSSIRQATYDQTASLKLLALPAGSPPPSAEVTTAINAIKNAAIAADRSRILSIHVVFGELSEVKLCFDQSARKVVCTNEYRTRYNIGSEIWQYRYDCTGWRAILTVPAVKVMGLILKKVVISVTLNIQNIDVNQCPDSPDQLLSGTALCTPAVAQCSPEAGKGFVLGAYSCKCVSCAGCQPVSGSSLLSPSIDAEDYMTSYCSSGAVPQTPATDSAPVSTAITTAGLVTVSMNKTSPEQVLNCPVSMLSSNCTTSQTPLEVYVMLGVQGLCAIACVIIAFVIIAYRTSQVIQFSICMILELVLLGAILIYSTVLLRYFPASDLLCYLLSWFRETGFVCLYGAVLLKTYKVLAEFQTFKARRLHIRHKDLCKYWFSCVAVVVIYLAGWTAANVNYTEKQGLKLVVPVVSVQGGTQYQCLETGWNYITQIAELLVLSFGLYMSYRLRKATPLFWESRFYAAVLSIEFIFSFTYYIISNIWRLNLYWSFILSFLHTQLTVSVVIILIFGPKLYYIKNDWKGSSFASRSGGDKTDHVDFRKHGKSDAANGEIDYTAMNLAEMDPDDIKKELLRVYEQLQAAKVKIMRYENPHLQSKRSKDKSKLPFYKQISRHGFNQRKGTRSSDIEINVTQADEGQELQPLSESAEHHYKDTKSF